MNDLNLDLTNLIPPTDGTTTNNRPPSNQSKLKDKTPVNKQIYKKRTLTPAKKKFVEVYSRTNNGIKAVTEAFPDRELTYGSKAVTATRLLKDVNVVNHIEYQRNKLELIANRAVDRVEEHVESDDSNVSFNASKFVIEQVHGKAVQKSSSVNFNFTQHVGDKSKDYGL